MGAAYRHQRKNHGATGRTNVIPSLPPEAPSGEKVMTVQGEIDALLHGFRV